jgi:monofunctional biosynthetic peptidoglycan transglycosylase
LLKRVALVVVSLLMAAAIVFFATLPDVRPLRTSWPKTTAFMERRKTELARAGEPTRLEWVPVPISRISPHLRQAVVAAEDARFYEHDGVDWEAVRGALEKDWQKRGLSAGASTITQQLAKNLYLSPDRTPWRKLKEWAITRRLERLLPKERILELYLNVVELGRRTYGVEAAARRYFGKSAASLTPPEAAMLAAMLPSPRIYDPVRHASRVERRARRILRWMRAVEAPTPIRVRLPEATPSPVLPSPPLPSN